MSKIKLAARRDIIHVAVRTALEKDGWIITDDPLRINLIDDNTGMEIDLGAEKVIAATKGKEKIAVEIKSFTTPSILYSFYEAFGQYLSYRDALMDEGNTRTLYLAVSIEVFNRLANMKFIQKRLKQYEIKILVVSINNQVIDKWIK